tara:strand:- start:1044 stop:1268 length:225 start_codon:yes stop_codon:yes gene_type:complete
MGGTHYVRTRAHVDAMIDDINNVKLAVVIGGGHTGLEGAAVLRKLGKEGMLNLGSVPCTLLRIHPEFFLLYRAI